MHPPPTGEMSEIPLQEAETASRSSAMDTLLVLAARRRFILRVTAIAAVLSVVVSLLLRNKYTAEATILPPVQNTSMSAAMLGQLTGAAGLASLAGAGLGIKNPGDMYVALFRSRSVEDALIQRFDLEKRYRCKNMADTRLAFESDSNVILGLKDNLIRLSFTDKDPAFAAAVTNAWIEEFRRHSDQLAITEASQRRDFFQHQLLDATAALAKAEDAMKDSARSSGVLQLDSQAKSVIESAAILRGQITAKEVELQGVRSFATNENPQVRVLQSELAELHAQLNRLTGSSSGTAEDLSLGKTNMPEAAMTYLDRTRDLRYAETVEQLIARQFEAAKLDEARQGAVIQIADPAVVPDKKSSPHRSLIVLAVTFLAFVGSVAWILASDRWQRSMLDSNRSLQAQQLGLLFRRKQSRSDSARKAQP